MDKYQSAKGLYTDELTLQVRSIHQIYQHYFCTNLLAMPKNRPKTNHTTHNKIVKINWRRRVRDGEQQEISSNMMNHYISNNRHERLYFSTGHLPTILGNDIRGRR